MARAQTMFELSRDWYAGRLEDVDWSPYTASEAEQIFRSHGLTGDVLGFGLIGPANSRAYQGFGP